MKTKKFSKKLVLNKKTIVNLNAVEMRRVVGGLTNNMCTWEGPACSNSDPNTKTATIPDD